MNTPNANTPNKQTSIILSFVAGLLGVAVFTMMIITALISHHFDSLEGLIRGFLVGVAATASFASGWYGLQSYKRNGKGAR